MTDLDRVTELFEKWAAEENEHLQAGEYGLAEGLAISIADLRAAVHGATGTSEDTRPSGIAHTVAADARAETTTVYSVQEWIDVDGIRDGWNTGYGYYTQSRHDAEATLAYRQREHPNVQFRIATAEVTAWAETL